MEQVTDTFGPLAALIHDAWPAGTMVDCEFVVLDEAGRDDFSAAQRIARCSAKTAQYRLTSKAWRFVAFDLLSLSMLPAHQVPYRERYALLERLLTDMPVTGIEPVAILPVAFDQAQQQALEAGWEGLVCWNADLPATLTLGNPSRTGSYRWKPYREADLVATGWLPMEGNPAMVGSLLLQDGQGRPVGKVGSGFTDVDRRRAVHWRYPTVVTVRYDCQMDNGLRFPRFMRVRHDKTVEEATCLR